MRRLLLQLTRSKVPRDIDLDYDDILLRYSSYYGRLDSPLRKVFRRRLYHLLHTIGFSSSQLPEIDREVRAVIGSAIIEITFGLRNYLPATFTQVVVLPHRYMYPGYGEPFLGHVDHKTKTMYFSWHDVKEGYLINDDAVNVALHEMAHILEAESRYQGVFTGFFDHIHWHQWAKLAFHKMHVIRQNGSSFLKSYGGINMSEMFAVSVETFFEQPHDFAEELPEIYDRLVQLLGQDPRRDGNPLL